MYLHELIHALKQHPPEQPVPFGFARPHSYRGYYHDLAFEHERDTTVGAMLAAAESALGTTYEGWKGGDFKMDAYTTVWLVHEQGKTGESLGPILLTYMLGEQP